MNNMFSCKDIGWCYLRKNKEPEIEVEQGERITIQSCTQGDNRDKNNLIERTNCFVITNQKKKIDKIKKITVKKTFYYSKNDKTENNQLEDIALQLQNTDQSIKYLSSSVE